MIFSFSETIEWETPTQNDFLDFHETNECENETKNDFFWLLKQVITSEAKR